MKAIRRRAVAAGAIALVAGGVAPRALLAQTNRQQPAPDTPRILIATFHAPPTSTSLGVEMAEAVRSRVQSENPIRQLYVLPKNDINQYLVSSGYKPDSALSPSDLKELAKLMRADEILDGMTTKTAAGVRVDARLMLARDVSLSQALAPVEARNSGDAAKAIERELTNARKALPDYKKCEAALREQKWNDAAAAARAGLAKDGSSTLSKLCLMSAYQYAKLGPDSVLRVAEDILRTDSANTLALRNAVQSYQDKNDTAKTVQTLVRLSRYDVSVRPAILDMLGRMNRADIAIPIVDQMLADNPGDPALLNMKFKLLANARQFKPALAVADTLMKADTTVGTPDFYQRLIAIAVTDSQPQLASQIAARAVQRYATNADIEMLYAQTLRQSGQLQQSLAAAQKAVQMNPKVENGIALVLVTYNDLNQPDSAFAWAKRIIASGADKDAVGQGLLASVGAAVKNAQAAEKSSEKGGPNSPKRQAWMRAYQLAAIVDSIAPSPNSAFFVGVSAFSVGLDALQNLNTTKSCAEATLVEETWAAAQVAMPRGGKVDANTASQILGAINQYSPNVAGAKKQLCRGSGKGGTRGR